MLSRIFRTIRCVELLSLCHVLLPYILSHRYSMFRQQLIFAGTVDFLGTRLVSEISVLLCKWHKSADGHILENLVIKHWHMLEWFYWKGMSHQVLQNHETKSSDNLKEFSLWCYIQQMNEHKKVKKNFLSHFYLFNKVGQVVPSLFFPWSELTTRVKCGSTGRLVDPLS